MDKITLQVDLDLILDIPRNFAITHPFPQTSSSQENYLEELAFNLIDEREKYPEMNLGQIYSINKMPRTKKSS